MVRTPGGILSAPVAQVCVPPGGLATSCRLSYFRVTFRLLFIIGAIYCAAAPDVAR